MTYFLHICLNKNNKDTKFLLISEQQLNGEPGQIMAQIYFVHPPIKLELAALEIATLAVSKQEIVDLLNMASDRGNISTKFSLFKQYTVKKEDPFRIFHYPTNQSIDNLLKSLNIKLPNKKDYQAKTIVPDEHHELDGKHRIYWDESPIAIKRAKKDIVEKWANNEIAETNLLNKHNIIKHIFNKYSKNIPKELHNKYQKFTNQMHDYYDELKLLADEIKSSGGVN